MQNNSRPVSEQGESNPVTSNKATQIVYKRQHLPPVPISNRRQSYVNSVFHTQKNPSCNFLQVGSDHKNHSASVLKGHRKIERPQATSVGSIHRHDGYWKFPSGLLSTCGCPVGKPHGRAHGRAWRGTKGNTRPCSSCTSRHEISGAQVWRELWRNELRCRETPSVKVTSHSDTAASSQAYRREYPESDPSFFQSLLECSRGKPLEVE